MIEFVAHNLAPIMFVSVMAMLLLGYPVAFTLAAGGLLFFVIGVEMAHVAPEQISLFWPLLQANPERVFGVMSNDTLLAIPFFTFMGIMLERSRMAEDLLETIGQLFGPVRGGLAFAVVVVGALLAATTGVVAASVIAMGLISLPIMMRYGYDNRVATGTIAAAGSLAQIIPPSLVLIVMADQLGRSVGDMYVGALIPGLMLVGLYCLYVFAITMLRPKAAPALPAEARTLGGGVMSLDRRPGRDGRCSMSSPTSSCSRPSATRRGWSRPRCWRRSPPTSSAWPTGRSSSVCCRGWPNRWSSS